MPTKYIVIVAAAVIVIGGVFAYMAYGKPAPQNPGDQNAQQTSDTNQQTPQGPGAFSGSLSDLIARGGNWQCDLSVQNAAAASTGTIYISGSKLRADFSSTIPQINQTVDSHMIQSDGTVSIWTSLSPQGFQTKTTLGTPDATAQFKTQGIDINQKYGYNCTAWTGDPTKFALPTGVKFTASN